MNRPPRSESVESVFLEKMEDDARLLDIASAIADGVPVDWAASSSTSNSDATSGILLRLQCLERVARGHEVVRTHGPESDSTTSHHTLLTEARENGRLTHDNPVRVHWGPLVVLEKIGRGSFGDVYRARDPRLDRDVALKLIPESATDAASPAIEEGRLLARVRHPNVLTVFGAERIGGRAGIWTELIQGETLAHEAARRGPLPADEVARIGIDVCRALTAVHGAGLLHRDVKAQNILRDQTGRLVLSDFGTGVSVEEDTSVTEPQIAGTPLYLAPEVCNHQSATTRSDLYSVGVLLYFLATGGYPVRGRTFAEIRRAHAAGARVPLRDTRPDVPDRFVEIVDTLLSCEPDRRYGSAEETERRLAAFIAPPSAALSSNRTSRLRIVAAALVTIALIMSAVGVWYWRAPTPAAQPRAAADAVRSLEIAPSPVEPAAAPTSLAAAPAVRFEARDWVLIAEFENVTGDPRLNGTLEQALERELSNSAFVNVAPRERIEDTLQLMRKPTATKMDARLGREVALRDGGVRAVIAGRVERIGGAYVLTARIVNPSDAAVLASVEQEAPSEGDLLHAVRRLAFDVRARLGEMLRTIRESEVALEKVTTPSLHAAQLYSQAAAFTWSDTARSVEPAEALLTQAVAEDPDFASAHILRALVANWLGRPPDEYLGHAARALSLGNRTSDVERYFITGTYHRLRAISTGDPGVPAALEDWRQAAAAYEALLQIKPDHTAITFLVHALTELRREPQATNLMARWADLRPTNLALRWSVAQRYFGRGDSTRGWHHLRKAEALITPEFAREHPEYGAQINQLQIGEAWLRKDVQRVRVLADDLARRVAIVDNPNAPMLAINLNLVGIYNALGRLGDAQRAAESLPQARRDEGLARVLFGAANLGKPGAKEALLGFFTARYRSLDLVPPNPLHTASLLVLGKMEDVRAAVARAKNDGYVLYNGRPIRWFARAAEARLALAEGRIEDSLQLFHETTELGGPSITQDAGSIADIAKAWIARGDPARAIALLESAATQDRWTASAVSSNFGGFAVAVNAWMREVDVLCELYHAAGRHNEEHVLNAELGRLLVEADEDFPIVVRLKTRLVAHHSISGRVD